MNVCIPTARVEQLKAQLLKGELDPNEIAKLLPEEKTAVKSILEDFVTDKLNISASPEEVKVISQKAAKIDEAQQKLGDDLGDPSKAKETVEFFKAKKEMDDYLQSHNPAPKLRVATGTIGRGMMLASVKSPLLNIGSNLEVGLTEGLARRITSMGLKGTDNQLAKAYIKMVNKVYRKTGYDMSRMMSLSDTGASGERVLDNTVHAQGAGAVRKIGRGAENLVFKNLMGAPDTAFASLHFADSANLNALKLAKGNKAEAREIMKDSMRIAPKTPEGELLRSQAVLDAEVATWTNNSLASQATIGMRNIFNKLSGDARVGDFLFPFVKTPANVIATGLDYAGLGIPKAMFKVVKGVRQGSLDRPLVQSAVRDSIRAGLGIGLATAIAYNLKPENFMGAYDPSRSQISELKNSNYNAIKIGNKWISTDWFGPLSVPLTAQLYAKKYGGSSSDKAVKYGAGLGSAVLNAPVISDIMDFAKHQTSPEDTTAEDTKESAINYALSQASARLTPSILSDIAKGTDKYQRQGNKGFAGVKQKLPYARESLPIKKNVLGQPDKNEGFLSTILFGSRVKTASDTKVTDEIQKVSKANDKSLNFTDWSKSNSKELSQFKDKVGQTKFDQAKDKYGQQLESNLNKALKSSDYQHASDEDKYKILSNADTEAKNKVFKDYGYKYKTTKSKKLSIF